MSSRERRLRQDGSAQAGIYLLRMCQTSLQTPPLAGATLSALTSGPRHPILSQLWAGLSYLSAAHRATANSGMKISTKEQSSIALSNFPETTVSQIQSFQPAAMG